MRTHPSEQQSELSKTKTREGWTEFHSAKNMFFQILRDPELPLTDLKARRLDAFVQRGLLSLKWTTMLCVYYL